MRVADVGTQVHCSLPGGRSRTRPWRFVTKTSHFRVELTVVVGITLSSIFGADLAAKQVAAAKTAVDRPHLPVTDSDEDRPRLEARRFAGGRNGVRIPRENQPIAEECTRKSGTSCLTPRSDPLTRPNVSHLLCLRESGFLESESTGRLSRPLHESGRGICKGVREFAPCQIPRHSPCRRWPRHDRRRTRQKSQDILPSRC